MHIHCLLALYSYAHLLQWHGARLSASWTVSVCRSAKERSYMDSLYNPESAISFVERGASAEILTEYVLVHYYLFIYLFAYLLTVFIVGIFMDDTFSG